MKIKRYLIMAVLLFVSLLWPTSAHLSSFKPIFRYALPADIMQVTFADEIWIYRSYEDGTIKKVVKKRSRGNQPREETAVRGTTVRD
jgi:hypothetical protein